MGASARIPGTDLTVKETLVVRDLADQALKGENISPSTAVMKHYNVKSKRNAQHMGNELMKKPKIQKAFHELLKDSKLDLKAIAGNIGKIANSRNYKLSGETVLKANIEALKIHGAYPTKQNNNMNVNINVGINDMNIEEIRDTINKLNKQSDYLLEV